jgi:transposase
LRWESGYWKFQHSHAKEKAKELEELVKEKDARIRYLEEQLYGRKTEKEAPSKSEKEQSGFTEKRNRGQQPGSVGHGRTNRPTLAVIHEEIDLCEEKKVCPDCGLPYVANSALDEQSDVIEVHVSAHIRRYRRFSYTRNPGCSCCNTPEIITAAPPPRLISRSPYGVSFFVEVVLGKYLYGQPLNRQLQDFKSQGLPVSSGTVTGCLQTIAPLFEPIQEALYCKQMSAQLFHNDETRWSVFVTVEGKNGTRWYLWVTRSVSVIFYSIDPSRSAAVPGAHFAGLKNDRAIIVCDRYSAYKKLARLAGGILLAFCWAHVRRDFLKAGRSFPELEQWVLEWKNRIGNLYHLNNLRLEYWQQELPLEQQSDEFQWHHLEIQDVLESMHYEAAKLVGATDNKSVMDSALKEQRKIYQSLLEHWSGLTLFVENPEVPLDNNLAENAIRAPVTGRKNYYGSGSIWSAELTATLFSILQTLELWNINQRHWLGAYLTACAENGGKPPEDITAFVPWLMDEKRLTELARPPPQQNLQ